MLEASAGQRGLFGELSVSEAKEKRRGVARAAPRHAAKAPEAERAKKPTKGAAAKPEPKNSTAKAASPGKAAPAEPAGDTIAHQLAAKQREISVSEFFTKNRHLLGFDNPRKA